MDSAAYWLGSAGRLPVDAWHVYKRPYLKKETIFSLLKIKIL